jgi:hypothetical protein
MSIKLYCSNPGNLLTQIKQAINEKKIETWKYDKDGDFTHATAQWSGLAWLRPSIGYGYLLLTLIPSTATSITSTVYAVYHGRFIEMAMAHFDREFSKAEGSAMPQDGDRLGGS